MRFVALAIVSIILLFAFGCIQGQKNEPVVSEPAANNSLPVQNTTNQTTAQASPCAEGNIVQKDACLYSLAKSRSDPETCRGIYSVEKLDSCYAQFAGSNLEICKRISDGGMRAGCLTENAKAAKSEELCNLIDNAELRAGCLRMVVPPCMLFTGQGERELCLALEKKDYTLCTKDDCFRNYAMNASNTDACLLISTEAGRYGCMAEVKGSVAECNGASQPAIRDLCVENSAKALGSLDGCDYATEGSDYRNNCYLDFAIKRHDMNLCRRAAPEEGRDQCFADYAKLAADTTSCPKVINTLNQVACYYFAAAYNRIPSLCNMLQVENQRNDCYSKGILQDAGPVPSDCEFVYSQDWKNKCYFKAARVTYNSTLCGFITPGPDKESCNLLFGS